MARLLDLYNIYVNTIISNESRRQQASAIYLSLISAGLALIGSVKSINIYYLIFPAIAISTIWLLTIIYFRSLAQAKIKVIEEAGSRYFCESLFWASQPKQAAKT